MKRSCPSEYVSIVISVVHAIVQNASKTAHRLLFVGIPLYQIDHQCRVRGRQSMPVLFAPTCILEEVGHDITTHQKLHDRFTFQTYLLTANTHTTILCIAEPLVHCSCDG